MNAREIERFERLTVDRDVLREQVREVIFGLQNHLVAFGSNLSRDERRGLLMCIHRLERGLEGKPDTDPARTLKDWLSA